MDTIVALSSGRPPAAIAVVRISGPLAIGIAESLAGQLPAPRRAGLRALQSEAGELLDRALVLVFPGPDSATGEDLVELHCHGGRAVTDVVIATIAAHRGVRLAEPGEFTRRALTNGRIDLAQAEGLADLLEAETQGQRRAALTASEGRVSGAVREWMAAVARMSAQVEATLDYAEEGDVAAEQTLIADVCRDASALREGMLRALAAPPVERLRDGIRVVIGGPPNSGKSTLLNLLCERDAAIVSPYSGTTRDRVEVPVRRGDLAYLFIDTAGLTEASDPVERIGVGLAESAISESDLLVWLGDDFPPRTDSVWVHSRSDMPGRNLVPPGRTLATAENDDATIEALWAEIELRSVRMIPSANDLPLRAAQRSAIETAADALSPQADPLILAEQLRLAARSLARILGIDATEAMLDQLFGRFCLGK